MKKTREDDAWVKAKIEVAVERADCECFLLLAKRVPEDGVMTIGGKTAKRIASALRAAGHPKSY